MRNNIVKKSGISLIVLIITITVALILVATVVISTTTAINNANITVFAKDLTEIQEATESYYITNSVMPNIDASNVMTAAELLAICSDSTLLNEELAENSDVDSQFYVIDLAKINVTKTAYGNKELGENDIFIVSFPTMNAYYPLGLKANGTTYFSITSKISTVTKVAPNILDDSLTTVITSGGIKVTKVNGWANKMGVSIDVNMATGETLYMSVSGDTEKLITTVTGNNTFGFNLLSAIVANTETIKVPTLTLAEADYIEAGTKPLGERYVDILKYNGVDLVGKVRIDLSNFSKNLPTISNAVLSSYENMNTVKLNLSNSESGIKEIRYEYLTKYTDNATIENYYNGISNFDSTYMQSKAKSAKIANDSTTTINAPKNVQSIKVAVIDKAGNVNLYNQEIAPRLYIGYTLDSSTRDSVQLTAKMFSVNGIKSIAFSRSVDGITFIDEQVHTLDTTTNGITTKQSSPFTNFTVDNAYIKMVAVNYNNTITETRIVKVGFNYVKANAAGTEITPGIALTQNSTINGKMPTYNNPVIPAGFVAINTADANWNNVSADWNNGLVIQDASGNQFVWVPVDGTNVQYAKWTTSGIEYNNLNLSNDTLPNEIINEANQIAKYKGFYIARYESMFDYNSGSIRVASKKSANKTITDWSATRNATYNGHLWNWINYTDSKTYAENMDTSYGYNTSLIVTNLITGAQWDTTLKWIQNSGKSVTDSRTWGNYNDSISPANISGYASLQISSYSDYWKVKNIYDLAGNIFEWTNEIYKSNRVRRGGDYVNSGSVFPADYRYSSLVDYVHSAVGFRVALYVL